MLGGAGHYQIEPVLALLSWKVATSLASWLSSALLRRRFLSSDVVALGPFPCSDNNENAAPLTSVLGLDWGGPAGCLLLFVFAGCSFDSNLFAPATQPIASPKMITIFFMGWGFAKILLLPHRVFGVGAEGVRCGIIRGNGTATNNKFTSRPLLLPLVTLSDRLACWAIAGKYEFY